MHLPNRDTFTEFLTAIDAAHQRELAALAQRADEIVRASSLGGPWTDTPGADALAQLHPNIQTDTPAGLQP